MSVNRLVANLLSCVISLSIPLGAATFAFMWVDLNHGPQPGTIALAVGALSFVVAASITDVFKCCIDTIFVCAFKDMAEHTPPKFMSKSLQSGFGLDNVEAPGPQIKKGGGAAASTSEPAAAEQCASMAARSACRPPGPWPVDVAIASRSATSAASQAAEAAAAREASMVAVSHTTTSALSLQRATSIGLAPS